MARVLVLTASVYVDDDFDIHSETFTSWHDGWVADLCGCGPASEECRLVGAGVRCLTEPQYDQYLDQELVGS